MLGHFLSPPGVLLSLPMLFLTWGANSTRTHQVTHPRALPLTFPSTAIGQLARSPEYPQRIRVASVFEPSACSLSVCLLVSKFSNFFLFHPPLFIQYSTEECSTVQLFIYKIIAVMIDIDTSWECIAVYGPVQYSTVQYSTVQYITTVIIDNKKFKIICSNCGSQFPDSTWLTRHKKSCK